MKISKSDIDLLADTLKEHNLTAVEYSDSNFSLKLENNGASNVAPFFSESSKFENQTIEEDVKANEVEVTEKPSNYFEVKSPIVGNYYSTKRPGEPNIVEIGDYVNEGDVIAIVEAMKVMNEVKSPVSGTVKEIVAVSGEFIDAMSVLMKIDKGE